MTTSADILAHCAKQLAPCNCIVILLKRDQKELKGGGRFSGIKVYLYCVVHLKQNLFCNSIAGWRYALYQSITNRI